jgi:hypothetical protein
MLHIPQIPLALTDNVNRSVEDEEKRDPAQTANPHCTHALIHIEMDALTNGAISVSDGSSIAVFIGRGPVLAVLTRGCLGGSDNPALPRCRRSRRIKA